MVSSRRFVTLGVAAIVALTMGLTACGSNGKSNGDTTQQTDSKNTNTAQEQQGAQNQKQEETSKDSQAETRVVKDEFGEVTIPAHPKRIAGIYVEDFLVSLGITPIVQWYHPSWGKQDYLNLDVPTFDITGNLEALLEASPDLIIVDGAVDKEKYELYSKIAPTYRLPEGILQEPAQILTTVADVVNEPEKGKQVMEQYKQKVADTKDKLTQATGEETVAVLRLNVGDKTLALFGIENRYTGNIYTELGLTPHPLARDMKESQQVLSEEAIPDINADHIIIFPSNGSWSSEENKEAEKMLESPLWKGLPAVKNGHVYMADRTHWQSGAVTANLKKMDDLLGWFVK